MFLFTFRFLNRKVALKMWKTPVEILKFLHSSPANRKKSDLKDFTLLYNGCKLAKHLFTRALFTKKNCNDYISFVNRLLTSKVRLNIKNILIKHY